MTRAPVAPVVMRAREVTKAYGGVHALKGVDFSVRAGAVTALFGENGAGKSTLMKILAGVETPSNGAVELDGEPVAFRSAADAVAHGVAIIHQELNLCPNLSVTDNVFLGRERTGWGGLLSARGQRRTTAALLARLEEPIDPDTLVGDLRLGQQQIVEIARAISLDTRVLIMDEPTSALSASEVEVLFRVIHDLTGNGVAIVYISHHLEEALEIADDVAVLRDGALVAAGRADEVDLGWIVANMVGRNPDDLYPRLTAPAGEPLLEIEGVSVVDPTNPARLAVDDLSLTVRAGEVVCLYGLMGAGRTELLEALAGRSPMRAGTVRVGGHDVTSTSIAERIALGLVLVPEDRQRDGLVQTMSVGDNLSLAAIGRLLAGPFIAGRREGDAIARTISSVTVKAAGPAAAITSLSGGNQQKVVLGKALLTEPRVLLLDEPTRGIDVGAKADIFALMAEQARQGVAVLFATSELGEALNAATRVLVMYRGRAVQVLDPATTSKEELMAASGEAEPPAPANGAIA
ncbi:sugar ABC transporter ATP-binding protein [Plantactinospora mayteni]|uniref:Sugar ABC transporter ATP-binding protein n=1 Tax=Plantactinospora mayteni TaxID=566021 RepID=A0ABQ4F0M9_9ACTN|nr:sugar ABC transporter ATP-binding protein [Plantactinospora mayteni]GIH00472.1 sugar ABC transporter ATP-binding protein [Plantactinospora mayteni]